MPICSQIFQIWKCHVENAIIRYWGKNDGLRRMVWRLRKTWQWLETDEPLYLRCCFAGHNDRYGEETFQKVYSVAESLVVDYHVIEFWVGNYGGFDCCAARAVRKLKEKYKNIELSLVILYLTKEINKYREQYYKDYDRIIMADIPVNTPRNLKIIKANEFIVDRCDFLICYVSHGWGGAAKTLERAEKTDWI